MKSNQSNKTGVSFLELLQLAFIILKIIGVINWSWWWVMAPTWLGLILFIAILFAMFSAAAMPYKNHKTK